MDEVLARRLLGAAAILGAAFIVASLLPEPEEERDEGIVAAYDLRTGQPIGPPVAEPAPVEHPPALKSDDKLAERPAEDAPLEAAEPPPAPAPESLPRPALRVDETFGSPSGAWFVQVGSFANEANARDAVRQLHNMELRPVTQSVSVSKRLWYRVRVGPYSTERAAAIVLGRIKKKGFKDARVVSPDSGTAPKGN